MNSSTLVIHTFRYADPLQENKMLTLESKNTASHAMRLLGITNADLYDAAGLAKRHCLATHSFGT